MFDVEVVLLIGQSSMVGQDTAAPSMPTDPRVWFWAGTLGAVWWGQAREPLHGAGYGPGADFGKHLLAIRPAVRSVMLIPCAMNGAATERWIPGGDLYERCLGLALSSGLRPTGALVYQGGSDAVSMERVDAWAGRIADMVCGFRAEYGASFTVAYGQLGTTPGTYASIYPYWTEMCAAQAGLSLPGVAMVPTSDLGRMADGIHLTWYGALTMGQRMARAFAELRRTGL